MKNDDKSKSELLVDWSNKTDRKLAAFYDRQSDADIAAEIESALAD